VSFRVAVYALVRRIPPGSVMTYGQVAASLGLPRAARAVGTALHFLPSPTDVPWWRVINASGGISISSVDHSAGFQRALLVDEGVVPSPNGTFDLERYRWWPSDADEEACRVTPAGLDALGEAIQPARAPRNAGRRSSPARRI
jgi:methylated-DNA-protein-cysteine methyltransferase-like protein